MKKLMVFGAICLSATLLLAQAKNQKGKDVAANHPPITPLNVKTGLWQSTVTIATVGSLGLPPDALAKMTPEQKARFEAAMQEHAGARSSTHTSKGCLTEKDLTTDPFSKADSDDENIHCRGKLLKSSSTNIVLQETCTGEASMTYTMKIHADSPEHTTGSGTGTATMGGRTMNSNVKFESKWLGATCPANLQHDN